MTVTSGERAGGSAFRAARRASFMDDLPKTGLWEAVRRAIPAECSAGTLPPRGGEMERGVQKNSPGGREHPPPYPPPQGGRGSLSRHPRASDSASLYRLDKNLDPAAAGQADLPGGLVGDAEFQRLRGAALDHVECLGHDRALDA